MPTEENRAVVFIDGQNLFHLAKDVWGRGYHWPKYDPIKLAEELTGLEPARSLEQVRLYTGVPDERDDAFWHYFWTAKLRAVQSQGAYVYRGRVLNGQEKGVDVRIALDLVRPARTRAYETAIVVSQDSDLNEALKEVLAVVKEQKRYVHLESAYPYEAGKPNVSRRGLVPSLWRRIDRAMYDRCVDKRDYRKPLPDTRAATIEDLKRKFKPDS